MELTEELVALQREQVRLLAELQADLLATTLAVHSLIATHPAPSALHAAVLDGMDRLADSLQPDRIPRYRAAIGRLLQSMPKPQP